MNMQYSFCEWQWLWWDVCDFGREHRTERKLFSYTLFVRKMVALPQPDNHTVKIQSAYTFSIEEKLYLVIIK